MTEPLPAKFPGLCLPCGEDIKPGEFIIGHPQAGWIHEECVDQVGNVPEMPTERFIEARTPVKVMPRGKTAQDRCDRCFQIPSSNGVCGCE